MLDFTTMTSKMVRGELFLRCRHTATSTRPRARNHPRGPGGKPSPNRRGIHWAHIVDDQVSKGAVVFATALVPSDQRHGLNASANKTCAHHRLNILVELLPSASGVEDGLHRPVPTAMRSDRCVVERQDDIPPQRKPAPRAPEFDGSPIPARDHG